MKGKLHYNIYRIFFLPYCCSVGCRSVVTPISAQQILVQILLLGWFPCVGFEKLTDCTFSQCLFHNPTSRILDINEIMIVSCILLCSLKNVSAEPGTLQLNCILLDTVIISTALCRVFCRGQNVGVTFVIILYKMYDVSSLSDLEEKPHQKF